MTCRWLRFVLVLAGMTAVGLGCSCQGTTVSIDRADAAISEGRTDAGSPAREWGDEDRAPSSRIDASVPQGQVCAATTLVWCDGLEDCPEGDVCCGAFDTQARAYPSVRCQPSCNPLRAEIEFCQPGDACSDNPDFACRRSFVLPTAYSICALPNASAPALDSTSERTKPAVACGQGECAVGQACCVRTTFDYQTRTDSWPVAYCVDNPAECSCADDARDPGTAGPRDAGVKETRDGARVEDDDGGA